MRRTRLSFVHLLFQAVLLCIMDRSKRSKGRPGDLTQDRKKAKASKLVERMLAKRARHSPGPEDRSVVVQVIYGDAGVDKAASAKKAFDGCYFEPCFTSPTTVWFDGYNCEEVLLLNDFCGAKMKYSDLTGLLDHGKQQLNVRRSFTWAKWKKVIITSSSHPSLWYSPSSMPNQESLKRRVTETLGIWRLEANGVISKTSWDMEDKVKTPQEFEDAVTTSAMPLQASSSCLGLLAFCA